MPDLSGSSLLVNAAVFLAAAGVIAWSGMQLASLADRLADRTGLGEALTGTIFLGLTTALPGLAASVTAALDGHPALAISNAIGGIAVQTTFLAVADVAHTRANLEHAAASVTNMIQATLLVILLGILLLGVVGPDVTVGHLHPVSLLLVAAAGAGFLLAYRSRTAPMWDPRPTEATVEDVPDESHLGEHLGKLIAGFVFNAAVIIAAGVAVAHTTGNVVERTGINETLAGALLSGIATSLPELVTTVSSVRRGALTLAVSDIVGGNFFDVLFVFAADAAFLGGSLYHAAGVGRREIFLIVLAMMLNLVFLLGLLYRQRAGPANIGFESVLIVLLYLGGFLVLSLLL